MMEKIRKFLTPAAQRRRKRALDNVRRQFANCGYVLDDLTDCQLEAAITRGKEQIEKTLPLTAKMIYRTIRRLSQEGKQIPGQKIKQPPRAARISR